MLINCARRMADWATVYVFVYEFVTGGGFVADDAPLPSSLLAEGRAMVSALVEDFSQIDGCSVYAMRDWRLSDLELPAQVSDVRDAFDERTTFCRLARAADWTVVIAPEFDGHLHSRTKLVEMEGGRLLGPDSKLVELATNKRRLAERLASSAVPAPTSCRVKPGDRPPADFPYPAVIKPVDGAGSLNVRLVNNADERLPNCTHERRLERLCPGVPVSVAFLCGPSGHTALAPCRQILSEDGQFRYRGGSLPLDPLLERRARSLTARAIETLENPLGYLGVDLILGDDPHGDDDVVIEINPRLTTSYVGLRRASNMNLAAAIMDLADGEKISLLFDRQSLQFDAMGAVYEVAGH